MRTSIEYGVRHYFGVRVTVKKQGTRITLFGDTPVFCANLGLRWSTAFRERDTL